MSTHTLQRPSNNQDTLTPAEYDQNARWILECLIRGWNPPVRLNCGPWDDRVVNDAVRIYESSSDEHKPTIVANMLYSLKESGRYADLEALLDGKEITASPQPPALQESSNTEDSEYFVPPLPQHIKANEARAGEASPILDAIIKFIGYWATRSCEGYHEAVALWVLATIAARRVYLAWKNGLWTPLYILLVAKSTLHGKSESSSYGARIIEDAGLGFLMAADDVGPQKLLSNMSGRYLPRNYADMSPERKEFERLKTAFAGQRSILHDEFGNELQEYINAKSGYKASFYGLLKKLYDCKKHYEYDTVQRGSEYIEMPYLALLGTATPDCLKPIANTNSPVWTDGFFARIAFVLPPPGDLRLRSAPPEDCVVPPHVIQALQDWHQRLGVPECRIDDNKDIADALENDAQKHGHHKKEKVREPYTVTKSELPQQHCFMDAEVYRAHQAYYQALVKLAFDHQLDEKFLSNYGRLPDMALRIAMLLASLENRGYIDMRHWGRGQLVAEHWRASFHELIKNLDSGSMNGYGAVETKVLDAIAKIGEMANARTISQQSTFLRKLGTPKVRDACDELAAAKVIAKEGGGKGALFGPLESQTEQKGW